MSRLSLGACVPNLKFASLVILELLAFNAQKFKGSRDPGPAPFSKKLSGLCRDFPWKHAWGDWKCKPCQMQYHENDGPNLTSGICNTWKMTNQIALLEYARPGKWRTESWGLENAGPIRFLKNNVWMSTYIELSWKICTKCLIRTRCCMLLGNQMHGWLLI